MVKKIVVFVAVLILAAIFFGGIGNMMNLGQAGLTNVVNTVQRGK